MCPRDGVWALPSQQRFPWFWLIANKCLLCSLHFWGFQDIKCKRWKSIESKHLQIFLLLLFRPCNHDDVTWLVNRRFINDLDYFKVWSVLFPWAHLFTSLARVWNAKQTCLLYCILASLYISTSDSMTCNYSWSHCFATKQLYVHCKLQCLYKCKQNPNTTVGMFTYKQKLNTAAVWNYACPRKSRELKWMCGTWMPCIEGKTERKYTIQPGLDA